MTATSRHATNGAVNALARAQCAHDPDALVLDNAETQTVRLVDFLPT